MKDGALPTTDGDQRKPLSGEKRFTAARLLIASLTTVAAVGAVLVARRALSAMTFQPKSQNRSGFDPAPAGTILQHITRIRAADGSQAIQATLLAEFPPGDRMATLHLAFCPPFERLPAVEVEPLDDTNVTVKLTQLLHNGAELEVRLPEPPDEPCNVKVELRASEVAPAS
jgi:hypothetical protein